MAQTNLTPAAKPIPTAILNEEKMTKDSWLILLFVCIAWIFDAADGTIFSLAMPSIRTEFGLSQTTIGFIGTMFLAGATLGSFLMPVVGEKFGRRWGMVACIALFSVFTGFVGIAGSAMAIGAARFLTGIGTGGEWPVGAAYLTEVVPAKKRGLFMGIMQSGYPAGYFLAGLIFATVASLGLSWRTCFFILAVPAMMIIPILTHLKESPVWAKRKIAERTHAATETAPKQTMKFSDLFAAEFRKPTIIALVLHIAAGFFNWGIIIWLPSLLVSDFKATSADIGKMFVIIYGIATVGYLSAGWLQDRIGRRMTLVICLAIGLVGVIGLNYLHGMQDPSMTIVFGFAIGMGVAMSINTPLITYTSEIFPARVRSYGLGLAVAAGKFAGIFCPTFMGMIADASSVSLALLFSTLFGWIALPAIIWGDETAGRKLAE